EEEYSDEEYADEEEYNDEEYVDEEEVVREITTKEIKEEDFLACVGNKEEKVNSKKVVKKKLRLKKGVKLFIYGLILLVSAGLLVFSGLKLFAWWQDNQKISKIEDEIGEMAVVEEVVDDENVEFFGEDGETSLSDYFYYIGLPLINVNFDDLLVKNSDTVGWIKVSGTNINYPVVQSADNDYYLHKAFDGTPNEAGWIFLDYRNNMENLAKNNIIYGHSRVDTTMFGTLPNIVKQSWFNNKDNHVVWLSTPTHNTLWQVFSVYIIDETSDYLQINFNDASYTAFIDMIKGRSKYDFGTSVTVNDKILSLSSCYGNTQRVVLHAKLIKKSTR
ncbi:MAG: class B sortase, partial [bacterium]|nr:class B sortase [bacterium]